MSTMAETKFAADATTSSIVPNAAWLGASQLVRRLLRMAVLFVAARLLGVANFGIYALLLTIVEMVATISGVGYADYLTREVAKAPANARSLGIRVTQIRFAYMVPCLGVAILLLGILRFPSTLIINAALLSLSLIPRIVAESAQGVLKGAQRFAPLPWLDFVYGAMLLAAVPIFVSHGFDVRGVIIAEIIAASLNALLAIILVFPLIRRGRSADVSLYGVARATVAFNIYPFIASIYDRIDLVLVARLAGNVAAGIYSIPYRVYATIQIIPYGLMGAYLPVFSARGVDGAARKACARSMEFLYLVALLAILTTTAYAGPAVLLLLGRPYAASALVIKILVWACIPTLLNYALNILLLAAGKEKVFIRTAAVCTIFNIGTNVLLIPRYSYVAAAVVTLLTEALLLLQNFYYVRRFFGELVLPANVGRITLGFSAALTCFLLLEQWIPGPLAGALVCIPCTVFVARRSEQLLRSQMASMRP